MGSNSVSGGLGSITQTFNNISNQVGNQIAQSTKDIGHSLTHLSDLNPFGTSTPIAAPPPPTAGEANTVALQAQLANERKMGAASSILTGGAGLLDEPTTASRVLLGS